MSAFLEMSTLYVTSREAWRKWLAANHDKERQGVWLVYYKQNTGKPTLLYNESVEEALCFGWVDSLIRKLDEERFARKFTPRKAKSRWSESNRTRVAVLMEKGLMEAPGLACVEAAKKSGLWEEQARAAPGELIHPEFSRSLEQCHAARVFFEKLTNAQRRQFVLWINDAKQDITRRRRISESIALLEQGRKLGMK